MPPGLDNRLDWWWWEAKSSLHNIGKGLRQGLNFVYLLTVLGFESDGAAHSPGGLDLRLPLDLRQFGIGLLGQVLKEGVLHLRGLHCSATWSGCLLLSRRKVLPVAEDQASHEARVEPHDDWLIAILLGRENVGHLKQVIAGTVLVI